MKVSSPVQAGSESQALSGCEPVRQFLKVNPAGPLVANAGMNFPKAHCRLERTRAEAARPSAPTLRTGEDGTRAGAPSFTAATAETDHCDPLVLRTLQLTEWSYKRFHLVVKLT